VQRPLRPDHRGGLTLFGPTPRRDCPEGAGPKEPSRCGRKGLRPCASSGHPAHPAVLRQLTRRYRLGRHGCREVCEISRQMSSVVPRTTGSANARLVSSSDRSFVTFASPGSETLFVGSRLGERGTPSKDSPLRPVDRVQVLIGSCPAARPGSARHHDSYDHRYGARCPSASRVHCDPQSRHVRIALTSGRVTPPASVPLDVVSGSPQRGHSASGIDADHRARVGQRGPTSGVPASAIASDRGNATYA
jgi:hypothetical protein